MAGLLERTLAAIDAANAEDPLQKEITYAQNMTGWLFRLEKSPDDVLQISARAQHIRRWDIPRKSYPDGRIGYLQWRTALYAHHAAITGRILQEQGYDSDTIQSVQRLLRKQGLKTDPAMQTLEDVICLVFLEHELADFAAQHPIEKVIDILRKTWRKMSERGHEAAADLLPMLPQSTQELLGKATQ